MVSIQKYKGEQEKSLVASAKRDQVTGGAKKK